MNSTQNNFIVLDYEGNEVGAFETPPSTPRPNNRYNLRSRTRNTLPLPEPQTPRKQVQTQTRPVPLIFCGNESPQQNTITVEAVAVDSAFNGTIVYEADDGSIVLRGFTRGLEYFTDRGATEDVDTESDEDAEYASEDEETEEVKGVDEIDLSGFTYEAYGRGYLLYPPLGYPATGQKYFLNAWWMPKYDAWFFKEQYLEYFESMGVANLTEQLDYMEEEEEELTEEEEEEEDEVDENDLSDFTYEPYGRGYLLYPPMDHPAIGEKYFFDAWWMQKFDAWFFKEEFLENFESMGVTELNAEETEEETEEEESEEEVYENDLSGFTYEAYGRGFLLFAPDEGHPDFGQKYFHDAWWMPKHNAWFFRRQHLVNFQNMGVTSA